MATEYERETPLWRSKGLWIGMVLLLAFFIWLTWYVLHDRAPLSTDASRSSPSVTTTQPSTTAPPSSSSSPSSSSPAASSITTSSSTAVLTTTTPPPPTTTTPAPTTTLPPPPPPANTVDSVGLTYCGWQDTPSGTLIATGDGGAPLWQAGGDPGLQIGQTYHFVRSGDNTNIVVGTDRIADAAGEACPAYFATAEWHNG